MKRWPRTPALRPIIAFLMLLHVPTISISAAYAQMPQDQLNEVKIDAGSYSVSAQIPDWAEETALPEGQSTEPMAIRLGDTQFLASDRPSVYIHHALQVNDPSSLSSAGQISIVFVPQYQHLTLHKLVIHRGQESLDRIQSSKPRFLQRDVNLERGVYNDAITASILVNDLRAGDTIEYAYSIDGQNPVFAGKYYDAASWDSYAPVMHRRVIMNVADGRDIKWRFVSENKQDQLHPTESTKGTLRRIEFNAENIPAPQAEQLVPSDYISGRWIEFSEYESWNEVAKWADELFKPEPFESTAFDELVARLKTETSDEKRLVSALEFVQREIRYFSIALGESSHRPTRPDVVLQRRYGDCKDKTLLLVTLLDRLGLESRPVLLSVQRRGGLDKGLPSPSSFDHAIVQARLKSKTYYLDPTRLGQHGKLEAMGQPYQGTQVLLVDAKTSNLTVVPVSQYREANRIEINETASFTKFGGEGHLTIRLVMNSVTAESMRVARQQMPSDQFTKFYTDKIEQRFPGAKIDGELSFVDDPENNFVTITTNYNVPNMAIEQSGNWFVRLDASNVKGILVPQPSSSRVAPMAIPDYPYNALYSMTLKLPENVNIWETPFALNTKNKHFESSLTSRYRGNMVYTIVSLKTRADRVLPADFKEYAKALQEIERYPIGAVVVPGKLAKIASTSKSKKTSDPAKTIEDDRRRQISNNTKAIDSGHLKGMDLASSYCSRSLARSDLGEFEGALADVAKALEIAPNDPTMIKCRAEARFAAGLFKESIEDQTLALTLGSEAGPRLQARAIDKFYAGMLEDAAEDFARVSEIDDPYNQVYSDIWLTWTLQRLNKPIPEDLAQRASMAATAPWPRPALAMLHGKLSPEDILALLKKKTGMEAAVDSCEGHFYIGQYYLIKGDKLKAREHFAKARELKVVHYTEYTAARFELEALGGVATNASAQTAKGSTSQVDGAGENKSTSQLETTAVPQAAPADGKTQPTVTGSISKRKSTRKSPSMKKEETDRMNSYFQ